jgi:hypothetical protein
LIIGACRSPGPRNTRVIVARILSGDAEMSHAAGRTVDLLAKSESESVAARREPEALF